MQSTLRVRLKTTRPPFSFLWILKESHINSFLLCTRSQTHNTITNSSNSNKHFFPFHIIVATKHKQQADYSATFYFLFCHFLVHAGSFCVSVTVIHWTLTWTTWSLKFNTCMWSFLLYMRGLGIPTVSQEKLKSFSCAPYGVQISYQIIQCVFVNRVCINLFRCHSHTHEYKWNVCQ